MEKNRIHTDNAPAAIGPYSQAIDIGEMIYTSGQIPVAPDGSISEDISEQTRQALLNLKAVIETGGSSLDKVIKTTVFITDMAQFAAINAVYAEFFTEPFPARSCVQVAALPKGVFIFAIAARVSTGPGETHTQRIPYFEPNCAIDFVRPYISPALEVG